MVSLERYLLQLHHDVKDYFDPVNAINELPASCDALIIDVNIPRIKFEEVCNIFTNKFPNIEVIILLDDF